MRLRRLEFVIIGVTLAFACFMGGFFTGRSWSAVNVATVTTQGGELNSAGDYSQSPEPVFNDQTGNSVPPAVQNEEASRNTAAGNESVVTPEAAGEPRGGDGRININLASQTELTDLPGIGSVLASRIVDYRRQHGDFQRIEDIRNVSGIGEKRFEAIQEKITVG